MEDNQIKFKADKEAKDIIKHIINMRKHKKITQERLAELSGLSRNTVVQIENGNVKISLTTFCALLSGLQVSSKEFFEGINLGKSLASNESYDIITTMQLLDSHPNRKTYLNILNELLAL